jgi:hypothetical protein
MSTATLGSPKVHPHSGRQPVVILASLGEIEIPPIETLDDFRRWVHSKSYPEKLKAHFIGGQVIV